MITTPCVVLQELLLLRRSPSQVTDSFRELKHDKDLVPRVLELTQEILDYFLKYCAISNRVQGMRDKGIDVRLRYDMNLDEKENDRFVGIQIKSFDDIRRGDVLKELKAQYVDACSEHEGALERYYILLCTDRKTHGVQIANVASELGKLPRVRVIEPEHCHAFLRLRSDTVSATVERLVREEDIVRKLARNEVADLSPAKLVFVLDMLVRFYNTGEPAVTPEELIDSVTDRIESLNGEGFHTIDSPHIDVIYHGMEETDFIRESAYDSQVRFDFESYRAVNALLTDATLRYQYEGDDLFHYLFETLSPSALGKSVED
ncbi:hypothetical protein ABH944_007415 [Caballeronia udeis]|uniref:Restriction endonuclease type IV Mrr domain-containing protein n=1 Tax=Caballeronia udeis TaxID=1232866 RepID=A0ABW8MTV1_9BURK